MTRPSKRKTKVKNQERDNNGKFTKRPRLIDELDEWGDENDSEWDDEISLLSEDKALEKPPELVWSDNTHLEHKKRGPYLTGKMKKSTYFDKFGPNGSFTKSKRFIDIKALIIP